MERKEKKIKEKESEVDALIDEAKIFIKNDFEAKKLSIATMEKELKEKEIKMKEKEKNLLEREEKVKEREEAVISIDRNSVEEEVGTAVQSIAKDITESIPVAEDDFKSWDNVLEGQMAAMVKFLRLLLLKI